MIPADDVAPEPEPEPVRPLPHRDHADPPSLPHPDQTAPGALSPPEPRGAPGRLHYCFTNTSTPTAGITTFSLPLLEVTIAPPLPTFCPP